MARDKDSSLDRYATRVAVEADRMVRQNIEKEQTKLKKVVWPDVGDGEAGAQIASYKEKYGQFEKFAASTQATCL